MNNKKEQIYDEISESPNIRLHNNPIYKKFEYKLPKDWIELIEPETKKPYYACLTTKHTQWLHPGIPLGTIMPNGLPYGWDYKIDPITKKKYYINHVGRFNTWSPPIKQRKYLGNEYIW